MFVDEVILEIEGGTGGNGKVSFFPSRGAPSGGSGGDGGNVYAISNPQLSSLNAYSNKLHLKAQDGEPGDKNRKAGADGENLLLEIPVGSTIIDLKTKEEHELNEKGEKILITLGGLGGLGNDALKSATHKTHNKAEPGQRGQTRDIRIILRLIADYGLIGIPNAGKSTLLNILTSANVKTADYPFTTLEPNLGVFNKKVIADIPGLIEGASSGKGLGIKFLKHIEKVSLLLHCISAESTDVKRDYLTVMNELAAFNQVLAEKKAIVLLTKTDLVDEKDVKKKMKELKKLNSQVCPVSILDDKSIEALKKII